MIDQDNLHTFNAETMTDEEIADRWVDEIPDDVNGHLIVIYSSGEFAQLLCERIGTRLPAKRGLITVVAVDPDPDEGRVGWRRMQEVIEHALMTRHSVDAGNQVPCHFSSFEVLGHPHRMNEEHAGENFQNIALAVHRSWGSYRASVDTRKARAIDFFNHVMGNVPYLPASVDLQQLLTVAGDGKANVVCIGGGPSHSDPHQLGQIREAQMRRSLFVVCCDRALPAVVDAGIQPDLVAAIDINDPKAEILKEYGPKVPAAVLVAPMTIHPKLTGAWRDHGNGFIAFAETGQPEGRYLPPMPEISHPISVGEFALDIAIAMEPKLIALLGYEFNDGWRGAGAGRPMRMRPGVAHMSITFDAFVGAVEASAIRADCPVWNLGYSNGAELAGTEDPLCPLSALYPPAPLYLPIDHFDVGDLESKLEHLRETPHMMLRYVGAQYVMDDPRGLDAIEPVIRRELLDHIQSEVGRALDKLRSDPIPEKGGEA